MGDIGYSEISTELLNHLILNVIEFNAPTQRLIDAYINDMYADEDFNREIHEEMYVKFIINEVLTGKILDGGDKLLNLSNMVTINMNRYYDVLHGHTFINRTLHNEYNNDDISSAFLYLTWNNCYHGMDHISVDSFLDKYMDANVTYFELKFKQSNTLHTIVIINI